MSWYTDPELFLYHWDTCSIVRITKKYNVPLVNKDIKDVGDLDFSKHLSLGDNEESDYDALKSILTKNSFRANPKKLMYVNCQGLVVYLDYLRGTGTWSREEEIDSVINSLPAIGINPFATLLAEKLQAVEKKNLELEKENYRLIDDNKLDYERHCELVAENSNLQEQLNQEKNDRQALEKLVLDLTSKLKECRGAGSGLSDVEPWMSGRMVPSNWVPFEELDVQNLPNGTPLTIAEAPGR
ncbi:hypothetical protein MKW94_028646, partial [Papaver nudicaule]|nr:hypothetical protein [Papaver nudicaule]